MDSNISEEKPVNSKHISEQDKPNTQTNADDNSDENISIWVNET